MDSQTLKKVNYRSKFVEAFIIDDDGSGACKLCNSKLSSFSAGTASRHLAAKHPVHYNDLKEKKKDVFLTKCTSEQLLSLFCSSSTMPLIYVNNEYFKVN